MVRPLGAIVVKALRDLTAEDLARFPIWQYEGQSNATATVSPVAGFDQPDRKVYIARTRFMLADGSEWWGYCSPTDNSGLDYVQPVILTPGGLVRFWYDEWPIEPEPERACRLLGRPLRQVFPVRFECMVPFQGRAEAGELLRIEISAKHDPPGERPRDCQ